MASGDTKIRIDNTLDERLKLLEELVSFLSFPYPILSSLLSRLVSVSYSLATHPHLRPFNSNHPSTVLPHFN